jgi:hypothetical protein
MVRHINVVSQIASLPLTGSTCTETLGTAAADGSANKKQKKPMIGEQANNAGSGMSKCKTRCTLRQREFDCVRPHTILISRRHVDDYSPRGFGAAVVLARLA